MAVDIKTLFNTELPAAIAKSPDKAAEIGNVFQLNVTGDAGGSWTINASKNDGGPYCKAGTNDKAECTITLADADFQKLVENPANGMQLFFAGKLKVQGNQMLAMKLQKLFDLTK